MNKEHCSLGRLAPSEKTHNTKSNADNIAELYSRSPQFKSHANRMKVCSNSIRRREILNVTTGELTVKTSTERCRVRNCPVCQRVRSSKLVFQLQPALETLTAEFPKYRWLFLTLTVKNCPVTELRETIKQMNEAWRRLIQIKETSIVKGWLRNVEVTRGKSDDTTAHPHFHVLLFVPSYYFGTGYIKQERWTELWRDAMRLDYKPQVNVQAVDSMLKGIQELTKATTYSVKPSELVDENGANWLHELHRQCEKLRFIASGGLVKKAIATAKENVIDVEIDGEIIESSDYAWQKAAKRYEMLKE
jgi:plasmid rolling circle replication initiator protein Rep